MRADEHPRKALGGAETFTTAEAADHIIYQANNYSAWLSAAGHQPLSEHLRDREHLRQSGLLKVVDPDTAITIIRDFISNVPLTHYYSWTLPIGLPPRWAHALPQPLIAILALLVLAGRASARSRAAHSCESACGRIKNCRVGSS